MTTQQTADRYTLTLEAVVATMTAESKFLQELSRFFAELGAGVIGFGALVLTISAAATGGPTPGMRLGVWLIVLSWLLAGALIVVCFHTLWGLYYVERHLSEALLLFSATPGNEDVADVNVLPSLGPVDSRLAAFIGEHYQEGREVFKKCERQLLRVGPVLFGAAVLAAALGVLSWLGLGPGAS